MKNFSDRLKSLRKEKDLTGEQLGKIFNVTKTAVSYWESGKNFPGEDMVKKIAEYFEVSTDFLLGKSDIRNPYITEGIEVREEQEKYNVAKLDDDISIWFSKDEYSDDLPEDVKNSMRDYLRFLLKEHGKKKNE